MAVICQCPSCKSKYQIGEQYAGRTVKCPKCSTAVVVPALVPPASPESASPKASTSAPTAKASSPSTQTELPDARPVKRASDPPTEAATKDSSSERVAKTAAVPPAADVTAPEESSAAQEETVTEAPPVDDELGFLAEESARSAARKGSRGRAAPKPRPAPVAHEPASDQDQPVGDAADDLAAISGLTARTSRTNDLHRPKKKKQSIPAWMIPAIAGVSIAGVLVVGVTVYLASNSKTKGGATAGLPAASGGKNSGKALGPKVPVLTIDWPESQRAGASLFVNDDKREIPATGAIEIPLPPSKEQYHFRLERRGFKPIAFARVSQDDDQGYAVSEWEPLVQGIDWPQDFEAAKKTAAAQNKSVLILFDASDSKESSFASGRFAEAVALRREFRERAEKEYVCVYIDNPKNDQAQARVENADRNRELTAKLGITVFPTVLVTNPKGQPFGILEGYKINGINAFLELMDQWEVDGKYLSGLLAKVDALPEGSRNSDLAGKVLDFLELNELERFYRPIIKDLNARLPKGESRPVTKELGDMWLERFRRAIRNPDELKKVVGEFDRWKKTRTFHDHDMGAKLHLMAAYILARGNLRTEATQECKEGLAFEPHDPLLRALLEQFCQALTGEHGDLPVGSGTGFCIAQGNYVLTNHHVIDGAKKIKVHLNGEKAKYPAKVIADNETGDMALLKIELPAGKKLSPLPLAEAGVKIGEDVCALGFPSVMSQNLTLTLTKGIVSTIPGADDAEGFIATDCKVNPGNSGGPLCNFGGSVAGMVTAKSHISSREDSYGLVIPVDRLRKFLAENLPHDSGKLAPGPAAAANLRLSELAESVAPSVVYIENIQ